MAFHSGGLTMVMVVTGGMGRKIGGNLNHGPRHQGGYPLPHSKELLQQCRLSSCVRSTIHVSLFSVAMTVLFFLLECLKSNGKATVRVAEPVCELFQNKAVSPFPTVTVAAALKRQLRLHPRSVGGFPDVPYPSQAQSSVKTI